MSQPATRKKTRKAPKSGTKTNEDPPSDTSPEADKQPRDTLGKDLHEGSDRTDDSVSTLSGATSEQTPSQDTSTPTPDADISPPNLDTSPPILPASVEIYLQAATDRFEKMLQKSIDKIVKKLESVEDNLAASLEFERNRIDGLYQHQQRVETELAELQVEVCKLRDEVTAQKEAANKNERFSRRNNIRLVGIAETSPTSKEDTIKIVEEIISTKFSITTKVERAHRDGMKKDGKPRHILVKLLSYREKVDIMKKCRDVLKSEVYFIADDLSKVDLQEKMKWSKNVQSLYQNGVKLRFFAGK